MAVIPFDLSYLIGGYLASALWGCYTIIFGMSMYFILTKRRAELFRPTTWIMVIMFCLATAHVFIALRRLVVALIDLRDKAPGPIAYLANIGEPLNRVKDLIYITNLVLGDSIIIWRCYAVWGGDLRAIALPVVMLVGEAIAGYGSIAQYFRLHPQLKVAVAWGTAMFSVSLATNVVVTGLTAGRIWHLTRWRKSALGAADNRYRAIILLVVESGAVIAAAKVVEFALFKTAPLAVAGDHKLYIVFDMMPQITGIMPTIIIAVVNAGFTSTSTYVSDARASTLPAHARIVFRPQRAAASTFGETTTGEIASSGGRDTETRGWSHSSADADVNVVDVDLKVLGSDLAKRDTRNDSFASSYSHLEKDEQKREEA